MYVFNNVLAEIEGPYRTIVFDVGIPLDVSRYNGLTELKPDESSPRHRYWMSDFGLAKKIANEQWLRTQIESFDAVGKNGGKGTVLLTYVDDNRSPTYSFLRGFSGGLIFITGKYLIVPRRGLDAPSSPGLLDGCFGRTTTIEEDDLQGLIFGETEEELILEAGKILIVPQLSGRYSGYNHSIRKRVLDAAKICGVNYSTLSPVDVRIELPDRPYKIIVRHDFFPSSTEFYCGLASLPHLSSLEPYAFALFDLGSEEDSIMVHDGEFNIKGSNPVPVGRDIFRINRITGEATVWSRGQEYKGHIKDILGQSRTELDQRLADFDGRLVSPKLITALKHWPTNTLGRIDGLAALYDYG